MTPRDQRDVVEGLQGMAKGHFNQWGDLGNITAKEKWFYDGRLDRCYVLLNYNKVAGRKSPWNMYEKVCRGLILELGTGRVVAWPFEKFFNIGEFDMQPSGQLVSVAEKLDGSLGIMYWDPEGNPCIATRGSFDSDHAIWATQFLRQWHGPTLELYAPRNWTLMFEIITPKFRNVIDYGPKPKLVLLGGRNTDTGEYLDWWTELSLLAKHCHFEVPDTTLASGNVLSVKALQAWAEDLSANEEGWVIEMSTGERWKIKGKEYVKLHRIIHNISLKRAFDAFTEGKTIVAQMPTDSLPEEHEHRWRYYEEMLNDVLMGHFHKGRTIFEERPTDDRKALAQWIYADKGRAEYSAFLFALDDGATIERLDQIVLKMMRRQYKAGDLDWIEENYVQPGV